MARQIVVDLIADSKKFTGPFNTAIDGAEKKTDGFGKKVGGVLGKFAKVAAAAGLVVGAVAVKIGKDSIAIASDTSEALSKAETVFGKASKDITNFAESSARTFGISKREALGFTSAMGSVATAMGLPRKQAAKLSLDYTKLSADLASFNNTSVEEAAEALKASVTGEYEMLKKFGIVVNDVTLAEEAQRQGMKKAGATWSQDQKLKLSNAIITRASADAQGDFARTSGGLANQQKILAARWEDLQGKLGKVLLPTMVKAVGIGLKLLDWAERMAPVVQQRLVPVFQEARRIFVLVSEKIDDLIQSFKSGQAGTTEFADTARTKFEGVKKVVVAVLDLIVAYIERTVKVLTWVWENFGDNIIDYAKDAWEFVSKIIDSALKVIQGVLQVFTGILKGDWRKTWEGIKNILSGAWSAMLATVKFFFKGIVDFIAGVGATLLRKAWQVVWGAVKSTAAGYFNWVIDKYKGLIGILAGLGKGIADAITAPFRAAVSAIKSAWNSTLGGRGFDGVSIPFAPDIPGFRIPYLAQGGVARGGMPHIVGEKGPELFVPNNTGTVVSNSKMMGALGGGGQTTIRFEFGSTDLDQLIRKRVRVLSGGGPNSVQKAFG